jgi:hypothetical protein
MAERSPSSGTAEKIFHFNKPQRRPPMHGVVLRGATVQEKAVQWAWMQTDNTPLPVDMIQKLASVGVNVVSRTAGELLDELDPTGLWTPGQAKRPVRPSLREPY